MVETPSLISYLDECVSNAMLPNPELLATFIKAYPVLIPHFFSLNEGVSPKNLEYLLKILIPPSRPLESPFSTSSLTDVISKTICLNDGIGNTSPSDVSHVNILGMSFLKPHKKYSADLILMTGNLAIVCDGASMIASPELPEFPKEVRNLCTTDEQEFLPDVFWSTAASIFLGKESFKSPFHSKLEVIATKIRHKYNFNSLLSDPYQSPIELIAMLNQMIYELYTSIIDLPLNTNTKVFYPSGVLGCVNLLTQEWASTGDIRIGHQINSQGGVVVVNNHKKVDHFDLAARDLSQALKVNVARHRANEIGNVQGLPIHIDSGTILPGNNQGRNPSTIALWTDGADIRELSRSNLRHAAKFSPNFIPEFSLAGTLLSIHPFLYHLYLLRYQSNHFNSVHASGTKTQWRADDSCCLVAQYKPSPNL